MRTSSSETLVAVGAWYDASSVDCWSEKTTATVSDKVDIVQAHADLGSQAVTHD